MAEETAKLFLVDKHDLILHEVSFVPLLVWGVLATLHQFSRVEQGNPEGVLGAVVFKQGMVRVGLMWNEACGRRYLLQVDVFYAVKPTSPSRAQTAYTVCSRRHQKSGHRTDGTKT